MDINMALDIAKTAIGVLYIYLEYNARRSMWVANIAMTCMGLWLYFNKGLYADVGINVYYLLLGFYGLATWGKSKDDGGATLRIRHISAGTALVYTAGWLAIWGLIAWILATFTDSTVVALDSFTTSLSIVGMLMLTRKYIEQWLVWVVVDTVYAYLYYHKGIYFSGTLIGAYAVIAVFGYFRWRRLISSKQA